jgi:crotonobetainyl-CoA:carnitine CoA-transferase CaiB-like acyl-CoA transferase
VTAALYARHRTGRGQHIELSMLDVALQFLWGEAHANYHYFVGAEEGGEKAPGLKPLPGGGAVNVTKNIIPETFAVHSCQDGFVSVCRCSLAPPPPPFAAYQ